MRNQKRTTKNKDEETKQAYFLWLCDKVEHRKGSCASREFFWYLHQLDFNSRIPNDENRAADGERLREIFEDEVLGYESQALHECGCTMLEFMIALAQKIDWFLSDPTRSDRVAKWFWEMVRNLELEMIDNDDPKAEEKARRNSEIINAFQERTYEENGKGGLFPLRRSNVDQRNVEIWYQMMEYMERNYK